MKKYQLEFTFQDDHVRRHGCARVSHSNKKEAEQMLLKAMAMTVKGGSVNQFLEIGVNQPDEHFPRQHVSIEIGIGAGDTCSSQLSKHLLLDDGDLTP